jgi:tRNA/tmRNA/rRNA uracil-C5-methylase (TrmA/RlmC/RlmD family)
MNSQASDCRDVQDKDKHKNHRCESSGLPGVNLAPGNTLTVTVSDIAFGGEGVARHEDFVMFVPFTAPGEVVEVEVTEVKKRFARAKLLSIASRSAERVTPLCRYFGECGGCQYQHLDYGTQLRTKHKQISEVLKRVGCLDPALVAPVVPCPQPYGYRNRIMIRSQWDKFKQGLNIGFLRAESRLVVDIEECRIAELALNEQIKQVRAHPPPRGGIKVVLRIPPPDWEVPRDSFFQNNFFLLPELVSVVGNRLGQAGTRHLVDVFCGVGFFCLELGGRVDSYIGVELDGLAIKAARKNAAARGRTNGEFVAGAAEEILPGLLRRFPARATTVLLDPPRTGCRPETLQMLRQDRPAQVIYVSCDPATMARDLNVLCAGDVFDLAQVVPLDMFPQTSHVEAVADLRSRTDMPEPKLSLPTTAASIQH